MEILKAPEIMVFISVAVAVIGVVIGGGAFLWKIQRAFASDVSGLRKEVKDDISGLRKEVKADISGLRNEVNSLGRHIAKIEGLLMPAPNTAHPQSAVGEKT